MSRPAGFGRLAHLRTAWVGLPPGPRVAAAALAGWMVIAISCAGSDLLAGGEDESRVAAREAMAGPGASPPSLDAIAQRPLFSMTRRPAAPPPLVVPAAPPPPPRDRQITLRGVFMDGTRAKAFVVSAEQPDGAWVAAGSRVGAWRVAAVEAERVRFEAEGESFSASMARETGQP